MTEPLYSLIEADCVEAMAAMEADSVDAIITDALRPHLHGQVVGLRRWLGIGTLKDEAHEPNPLVAWVVQDKAGCQRLVDILDVLRDIRQ